MSQQPVPPSAAGFEPSQQDVDSVLDWFARYDEHAAQGNVEQMADMAMFPVNEVSDGGDGNGSVRACSREEFVDQMRQMVGGAGDISMESTRTPHFLNENLVFVITDAVITAGGNTTKVRYADLLMKSQGQWVFQTMVQGGWGEF